MSTRNPYAGNLYDLYQNTTYARHAGLESIEANLRTAKARLRKAQRLVTWLEELSVQRKAEVAAGTWPARPKQVAADKEMTQ